MEKHPGEVFKKKTELAKEILEDKFTRYQGKIPKSRITLLTDNSYATKEILGFTSENGHIYVGRLAKDRQIRLFSQWKRVDWYFTRYKKEHYFTDKETGVKVFYKEAMLDVKGLGRVKVFAFREEGDEEYKFFVTNKHRMTARTCYKYRKTRWKVDTMHRELKQFCGLENTCFWKPETLLPHFKVAFFLWWLFERFREGLRRQGREVSFESLWWEYKADVDRLKAAKIQLGEPPPISLLFNYV